MEQVHLDILGPQPHTDQGFEYVLVMVYQFKKRVELAPIKTQTVEETVEVVIVGNLRL